MLYMFFVEKTRKFSKESCVFRLETETLNIQPTNTPDMSSELLTQLVNSANELIDTKKDLDSKEKALESSNNILTSHLKDIFNEYLSTRPEIPKENFSVYITPCFVDLKEHIRISDISVVYTIGEQKYKGDWPLPEPALPVIDVTSKFSDFIDQNKLQNTCIRKVMGSLDTLEEKKFYQNL